MVCKYVFYFSWRCITSFDKKNYAGNAALHMKSIFPHRYAVMIKHPVSSGILRNPNNKKPIAVAVTGMVGIQFLPHLYFTSTDRNNDRDFHSCHTLNFLRIFCIYNSATPIEQVFRVLWQHISASQIGKCNNATCYYMYIMIWFHIAPFALSLYSVLIRSCRW